MVDYLTVGKIVNTHGIRGEVRVISKTDFPDERYKKGSKLFLEHPNFPELKELTVTSHREHKNFILLTFDGYTNVNHVEPFKGGTLKVPKEDLVPLTEGEFYYHQIIGCKVFDEEEQEIGRIKEILSPGANDVWIIQRVGQKDLLIPYIEDVVKSVDVEEKKVIIHLMEGLL